MTTIILGWNSKLLASQLQIPTNQPPVPVNQNRTVDKSLGRRARTGHENERDEQLLQMPAAPPIKEEHYEFCSMKDQLCKCNGSISFGHGANWSAPTEVSR